MPNTIQHYHALMPTLKLPTMQQGNITAKTEHFDFTEANKLHSHIESKKPKQGWICYQSAIKQFENIQDGKLPAFDEQTGHILNAEFVLDKQSSLHIRQNKTGWVATHLTEGAGDKPISPTHYLQMTNPEAVRANQAEYLYYRTQWEHDAANGYQPALYRFTGFNKEA